MNCGGHLISSMFNGNYQDLESQYQALMDNGISAAKRFNLKVGVALSAEQVAALTTDIVWLEKEFVLLADGRKVEVLVPRIYALPRPEDVKSHGALLAGNRVLINANKLNNQGTVAGRELTLLKTENLTNQGNIQGGQVGIEVQQDFNQQGGSVEAENALLVNVGGDFTLSSTTQHTDIQGKHFSRNQTNLGRKASLHVKGEQGQLQIAAQNINLTGAEVVNDGKGLTLISAKDNLNLDVVKTGFKEKLGTGNHYRNSSEENVVVSHIQGKGDVQLQAHNITSLGAEISAQDKLNLIAENDLVLNSAETATQFEEYHKQKSGSAISSTTQERYHFNAQTNKVGSQLSGNTINLSAGQDVNAKGAQIVADKNLNIVAGNNVNISADTNHFKQEHWEKTKTSGVFSGGGLGITFGKKSEYHQSEAEGWMQSDVRGTVGSLEGDLNIQAGNHANVLGSDLITNQAHQLTITGKSLNIEAGKDRIIQNERHEYKQSGLTLALSTPVTDALLAVNNALQRRQQVKSQKLKDIYALKAGYELSNAVGGLNATLDTFSNMSGAKENAKAAQNPTIKISASIGSSQSIQTSHSESLTHSASALNSGKLSLRTTDGDLSIKGSSLNAEKMRLASAKNIELESVQDRQSNRTNSKNSGWSAGVFVGYNGNSYGFGLEASGQIGKGRENSDSLQQRNSTIQANQLEITSQYDTNLKGAVVQGNKVTLTADNLNIESRQDSQTYHSKQTQAGAGVSIALGSGGSASANFSLNKAKMNYAQVEEQSGLQIGKDGMNVSVANNTHLKGGLIESQAEASKNQLHTKTLSAENIKNHSEVSVQSISAGFSTAGVAQNVMSAMGTVASALGNKNDTASSTTYSAVGSNVHLDIKTPEKSPALLSLSRNTKNANEKVQRFDVAEIKEQQEAAQVAGELAARIVGDVSKQLQLKDGSKEKIALHAFAGFLAAKAGDGNAFAGAAAGAASEWLNTQVADYLSQHKNLTEDERKAIQQASALGIGAIAGALTGGGTEAIKQGAITSFNAEKFNRQLHPDDKKRIKDLAKGDEEKEYLLTAAACALVRWCIVQRKFQMTSLTMRNLMQKPKHWRISAIGRN